MLPGPVYNTHPVRTKLATICTIVMVAMITAHLAHSYARAQSYDPARGPGWKVSLDQDLSALPRRGAAPGDTLTLGSYDFDAGAGVDPQGWVALDRTVGLTDFGNFAGLLQGYNLVQEDPCRSEITPMWHFFENSPDNYACGGFPVQKAVPRGNPTDGYIHNEIVSPAMAIQPGGSWIEVEFLVYRDLPLENLVFYTCRVQCITAQGPGPWRDNGTIFYGGNKDWKTHVARIGHLIELGTDSLRVAIGVVDMAAGWGGILGSGTCHSQAPLIDEVRVRHIQKSGPRIHVEDIDLFQDSFASDGTITGTVRIDAARDINPRTNPAIRPGDSMVVWVGDFEAGISTAAGGGPDVYLYVNAWPDRGLLGTEVSGDPGRWPVTDAGGGWAQVQMDSIRNGPSAADPVIPGTEGRFCVDLADDYFVAGDTVGFYVGARNTVGDWSYWSEFAGQTGDRDETRSAPSEMTCLPAGGYNNGGDILYIDDFDQRGAQPFFDTAFQFLGIFDEVDRYDVRGADRLSGNGPGARVVDVAQQLVGVYRAIIWNSGDLATGTIGDGSGMPEKSPDAQMLAEFLDTSPGRAGVYISGDGVAWELENLAGASALRQFIDYNVASRNANKAGFGTAPIGTGAGDGMFDHILGPDQFVIYGGCPKINQFDVLSAQGEANPQMLYGDGNPAASAIISQEALNANRADVGVILSGFSYHYIRDAFPASVPSRVHHLEDILTWIENPPGPPCGTDWVRASRTDQPEVLTTWTLSRCSGPFDVFRVTREADGDSVTIADNIASDIREYLDTSPVYATTNVYRVLAREPGETEWKELGHGSGVLMPVNPGTITARSVGAGVELSWGLIGKHAVAGFVIERRTTGLLEHIHPGQLPANARSYLDRGVPPGERYTYRFTLYSKEGIPHPVGYASITPVASTTLQQNYPNPFNPSTTIGFSVASLDHVTIVIYDVAGRRVRSLYDDIPPNVGYHEIEWDGTNDKGDVVGSGVYFYRMTAPGLDEAKRMVMVR